MHPIGSPWTLFKQDKKDWKSGWSDRVERTRFSQKYDREDGKPKIIEKVRFIEFVK